MSKTKSVKTLARLISSGFCPAEDARRYSIELNQLIEQITKDETIDKQSRFFKVLADETRLRILRLLEVREMCVCEVMVALGLTQPTASYHLRILENSGLVKDRRKGKWVFYALTNPKFVENIRKLHLP